MSNPNFRLLLALAVALAIIALAVIAALDVLTAHAAPIIGQPPAQQYIPLVQGGGAVYPPDPLRYANSDHPLTEWDYPGWCASGVYCNPVNDGEFEYYAPAGFVIVLVRIYSYDVSPGGGTVLYPWDGCWTARILCVDTTEGTDIAAGDARAIRVYSRNWTGHWQVIDICHGLIGQPGRVYCDGNYLTRAVEAEKQTR